MNYSYYFPEFLISSENTTVWSNSKILKAYLDSLKTEYYFISGPKETFFIYYSAAPEDFEVKQSVTVDETFFSCDTIIKCISNPDDIDSRFLAEIITDDFNKNSKILRAVLDERDMEIKINTKFLPSENFNENNFQYYYDAFNKLVIEPKQSVFSKIIPMF